MAHIRVLVRLLIEETRLVLETRQWPDNESFLRAAYLAFLKREPDEDGRQYYLKALERNSLDWPGVLRCLVRSNEFRQVNGFPVNPLDIQHYSRMILVQQCLPPAGVIVDLGGAAENDREGALLIMGYSHCPRQIIIVDLPSTQRTWQVNAEPFQSFVTTNGTSVRYLYRSMTDLAPIRSESVDLVWSGESIEHVTEAEADIVCQEAYRVLKPGGYFCLDTPNAALTRLQSPDAFIHPEHKKEYQVHELRVKLERWGFQIIEAKGICLMTQSLQRGVFDIGETVRNIGLSDKPEESYMFFLKATKPLCDTP